MSLFGVVKSHPTAAKEGFYHEPTQNYVCEEIANALKAKVSDVKVKTTVAYGNQSFEVKFKFSHSDGRYSFELDQDAPSHGSDSGAFIKESVVELCAKVRFGCADFMKLDKRPLKVTSMSGNENVRGTMEEFIHTVAHNFMVEGFNTTARRNNASPPASPN